MKEFIAGLGHVWLVIVLLTVLVGVIVLAFAAFKLVSLLCTVVLGWGAVTSWFAGIGAAAVVITAGGVSYDN